MLYNNLLPLLLLLLLLLLRLWQFKVDDNTVYDLHKLAKVGEAMYGPIDDTNHRCGIDM
jgi:hypothetical protein